MHRDSLGQDLYLGMDDTWTSATLETQLCAGLTSAVDSVRLQTSSALPLQTQLELPDCFWSASNLVMVTFVSIVVRGNATFPNPYERIYKTMTYSNATTDFANLRLDYSSLLTDTGENATFNWDTLASALPRLSYLSVSHTALGNSTLPQRLPGSITVLYLINCGLNGTIPATFLELYQSVTGFAVSLSNNQLEGTIPDTLLSTQDFSTMPTFALDLSLNRLTGTIPKTLLSGSYSSLSTFSLVLAYNQLEGPLSNALDTASFSTPSTVVLHFTGNRGLNGTIPNWFGTKCLSMFAFSAGGCSLTGTIPNLVTGGCSTTYIALVNVSDNQLEGPISSSFFKLIAGNTTTSAYWTILFNNNRLNGTVPANLFEHLLLGNSPIYDHVFDFSNNQLSGGLPNRVPVLTGYVGYTTSLTINFSSNPLMTGSIPSTLLPSFTEGMDATTATAPILITLDVSHTGLTGALDIPDLSYATDLNLTILASGSNLTSFTIADNASSPLSTLDVSDNPLLAYMNLTRLFLNAPRLTSFAAAGTKLNVTMPGADVLSAARLSSLDLSATSIDFCSGPRSTWESSSLTSCILNDTSAYDCSDKYPSQCLVSAVLVEPVAAVVPVAQPLVAPTPVGCVASARPSTDFVCVGSTWTFTGTVNKTVLVIPAGATQTIINGNVTSSTVVITGLDSVLVITGCASNLIVITIELTPADLERIGSEGKLQKLLEFGSNATNCSNSLSSVVVSTKVTGKTCKKVTVTKEESAGQLSGLFRVNNSGCNRWWIILVSVICAVVVLVVVVIAVVWNVCKSSADAKHRKRLSNSKG